MKNKKKIFKECKNSVCVCVIDKFQNIHTVKYYATIKKQVSKK